MDPTLGLLGGDGLSSEGSSYQNEAEIELGLGLSLTGSGGGGGDGFGPLKQKGGSTWGDCGRILTAKDFPSGFPAGRAGPSSAISGTKRTADCVSSSAVSGQVVGWPPIRAYRMNSLVSSQAKAAKIEEDKGVGGNDNNKGNLKKKADWERIANNIDPSSSVKKEQKGYIAFVKVNMDGLPIGRKVDLNAHSCYETLAQNLEHMFFKSPATVGSVWSSREKDQVKQPSKLLDGSSEFVLTYEDKEGDWMLVGDVPWGMFLGAVKRLRIMRTSDANGLAPRQQEMKGEHKGKPL